MQAPWQPVLEWWFGSADTAKAVAAEQGRLWFGKRDSQDLEARTRFGALVEQALAGGLTEWAQHPQGWLALVLLLDQVPRMIFRENPQSFAGDARALALVAQGIAADFDRQLRPIERVFIYIVFEHCENLAAQNEAIARYTELLAQQPAEDRGLFADYLDYAEKHQRVIAQFGRFPHRNQVLGRESTEDELVFLSKPGSRF